MASEICDTLVDVDLEFVQKFITYKQNMLLLLLLNRDKLFIFHFLFPFLCERLVGRGWGWALLDGWFIIAFDNNVDNYFCIDIKSYLL